MNRLRWCWDSPDLQPISQASTIAASPPPRWEGPPTLRSRAGRWRWEVGRLAVFGEADAAGFCGPPGVAWTGTRLFVADRMNHGILIWRGFPTARGQPADAVMGQRSFTANLANAGQGIYRPTPS